jgi:hypothetical protein
VLLSVALGVNLVSLINNIIVKGAKMRRKQLMKARLTKKQEKQKRARWKAPNKTYTKTKASEVREIPVTSEMVELYINRR